jgi:DNA-binding NtrC family response regulator
MGYRALVIDDDAAVRTVVTRFLSEELGLETSMAQTGSEALIQLEHHPVDLVITDLKMPGLSGIEVIEAAKARCPRAEVLLMTGFATVESAVHAMKLGAFDYLQKPFPLPQLASMVERALGRIKGRAAEPNDPFLTPGPASTRLLEEARRLAQSDLPLLVTGETGTGKTHLARAIHAMGPRKQRPVRTLRCAALAHELQEAELLKAGGLLDETAGGTLVVAQVWAASPTVQRELVRVLDAQEAAAGRQGPAESVVPARVIATTDRDLATRARRGGFRPDLYERLAPRTLTLLPLRERRDEIGPLAAGLIGRVARRIEGPVERLAPDAVAWLSAGAWPGNVAELLAALERAALLAEGPVLEARHLDEADDRNAKRRAATSEDDAPVSRREKDRIVEALRRNAYNLTLTYQQLGMSRTTLWRKLKRYGITLTRSVDGDGAAADA